MTGWLRVKKQDMEAGLAATHAEGWGTNRPRDATMQGRGRVNAETEVQNVGSWFLYGRSCC